MCPWLCGQAHFDPDKLLCKLRTAQFRFLWPACLPLCMAALICSCPHAKQDSPLSHCQVDYACSLVCVCVHACTRVHMRAHLFLIQEASLQSLDA